LFVVHGSGRLARTMQVAIVGDRTSTLPADWAKETVVSLVGDVRLDASAGARDGASLTTAGLFGDALVTDGA
jgi:hypothetical protein